MLRYVRYRLQMLLGGVIFEAYYVLAQRRLRSKLFPTARVAFAVHVFYTDRWDLLAQRLADAKEVRFDLFVTLPFCRRGFAETIRADFPDAYVILVPNRGRGTLPFIKIAQVLVERHYEVVLKLHGKGFGSGRRDGDYLEVVLERLLPESPELMREVIEQLALPETAMIGASEVYVPLDAALSAHRDRLGALISNLCGRTLAREVLDDPVAYGFFAGSMFWARLDAIAPLLGFHAFDFDPELGPGKATLAHVLERAFSLIPRLQGREVFELADGVVRSRESVSSAVVWWDAPMPLRKGKIS